MPKVNKTLIAIVTLCMFALLSCNSGPEPIRLGKDACSFCKMSIADKRFGAEVITKKGKVFKFDDMHCVLAFMKAKTVDQNDIKETWLVNFEEPHNFIEVQKAFLLKSAELHSPMGGNVAAFDDENKLKATMEKVKGERKTWNALENEK